MPKTKTKPPLESCLGDPISFYNGEVILRFATDPYHEYYLVNQDGSLEKQDGVTGVSGILDKSFYLKPWTAKVTIDKLLRTVPTDEDETGQKLVCSIPWSEFEQIALDAKKAHTQIFEDAGDVGTQAHSWLEDSIRWAITFNNGVVEKLTDKKPEDERAVNCGLAAFRWMELHQVKWIKTEHKVYSRKYKYAGTMDGKAIVHACTDPKCCPEDFHNHLSIIDFKSSNQLSKDYLLQVAAYKQAEMEEFLEKIDDIWVLRLGKETGDFEPWHLPHDTFEMDFEAFRMCLQLKRQMRMIESRMSNYKKDRTARKRAAKKNDKSK